MHIKKHLLLVLLIVGPIVSQFSLLGKLFGADMTQVQNNVQKNDVGVDNTINLRAEVEAEKKINLLKEEYRREAWSELKFWVSFVLSGALLIMTLCLAWSCKGALMKKLKRHNAQPVLPMEQFAIL